MPPKPCGCSWAAFCVLQAAEEPVSRVGAAAPLLTRVDEFGACSVVESPEDNLAPTRFENVGAGQAAGQLGGRASRAVLGSPLGLRTAIEPQANACAVGLSAAARVPCCHPPLQVDGKRVEDGRYAAFTKDISGSYDDAARPAELGCWALGGRARRWVATGREASYSRLARPSAAVAAPSSRPQPGIHHSGLQARIASCRVQHWRQLPTTSPLAATSRHSRRHSPAFPVSSAFLLHTCPHSVAQWLPLGAEFIPKARQYTDPVRTFAYGTDASFYRLNPKMVVKVGHMPAGPFTSFAALAAAGSCSWPVLLRLPGLPPHSKVWCACPMNLGGVLLSLT